MSKSKSVKTKDPFASSTARRQPPTITTTATTTATAALSAEGNHASVTDRDPDVVPLETLTNADVLLLLDYLHLQQYSGVFRDTNVTGKVLCAYCVSRPLVVKLGISGPGHADLFFSLMSDYLTRGVPSFLLHENHHAAAVAVAAVTPVSYCAIGVSLLDNPLTTEVSGLYSPVRALQCERLVYVNTATGTRLQYDGVYHRWTILKPSHADGDGDGDDGDGDRNGDDGAVVLAYVITASESNTYYTATLPSP